MEITSKKLLKLADRIKYEFSLAMEHKTENQKFRHFLYKN